MPLGRKKNWFAKFGRRNHKQAAMKKNAEIQYLLLLHLQFQYGCKDSGRKAMLVVFHCILGSGLMDHPPRGTRSSKHRVIDRGQALALLLQRETLGMANLALLSLPPASTHFLSHNMVKWYVEACLGCFMFPSIIFHRSTLIVHPSQHYLFVTNQVEQSIISSDPIAAFL